MGQTGQAGRSGQITRAEVIRAGRRRFLAGQRIDLVAIAAELGIARATVYRWFGDRDRFMGHVLWSLSSDTLDLALERRRPPAAEGLITALMDMLAEISESQPFRTFLAADPGRAMHVLTGRDSVVADSLRVRLTELVLDESPESAGPDLAAAELGYSLVRLAEAYLYADLITGCQVDLERARPLFRRLLKREAPLRPGAGSGL